MLEFIKKYFYNQENSDSRYNSPATQKQITDLENLLHITLPQDYKDFLSVTNGFEGEIGNFITIFESVENIYQTTQDICAEHFPWAIFIGSNGNLEMFVIDKRTSPIQFGLLPYIADDNDFIPLGNTFEQFITRLKEDTAFKH